MLDLDLRKCFGQLHISFWTQKLLLKSIQLPLFLGGSCTCNIGGGCLRYNKGPWNDPEIIKAMCNAETTLLWQVEKIARDSYITIYPLQGRSSDTSIVESLSDVGDPCSPTNKNSSMLSRVTLVHEETRASDPCIYYSSDEDFSPADKGGDHEQGEEDESLEIHNG